MTTFATERLECTSGERLIFHKVFVNGECPFDEFCTEIEKSTSYKGELATLLAYMDFMSSGSSIPPNRLHSLTNIAHGYEFKSKHLRIYIIKHSPNAYIVLGGKKTTQKIDLNRFARIASELAASQNL